MRAFNLFILFTIHLVIITSVAAPWQATETTPKKEVSRSAVAGLDYLMGCVNPNVFQDETATAAASAPQRIIEKSLCCTSALRPGAASRVKIKRTHQRGASSSALHREPLEGPLVSTSLTTSELYHIPRKNQLIFYQNPTKCIL